MPRSPLVQLVIALAIVMVIGIIAGGGIFASLTGVEPTLFVRLSLGIAACCFLGFVVTLYRVLLGLPPIDLAMPSRLSPIAALGVTVAAAVLIATTVFR